MTMSMGGNPHRNDPVPSHMARPAPPPLVTESGALPASEVEPTVPEPNSGETAGVTSGEEGTEEKETPTPRYKDIIPIERPTRDGSPHKPGNDDAKGSTS